MKNLIYLSAIALMVLLLSSCGVFYKFAILSVENDSGTDIEVTVDGTITKVPDKSIREIAIVWNSDKGNVHRHPFSYSATVSGVKSTRSCYVAMVNAEYTHLEFTSIEGINRLTVSQQGLFHCTFG